MTKIFQGEIIDRLEEDPMKMTDEEFEVILIIIETECYGRDFKVRLT